MSGLILALLSLAALSLGLRTTSVLVSLRVHRLIRLALAVFVGLIMTLTILQVCRNYQVFELGLGLLVSLAPVGVYDLAKWWFRRG